MSSHSGAGTTPTGPPDDERRGRLLRLLDEKPVSEDRAAGRRGWSSSGARLARLCELCVCEVGVDGAGITVMGSLDGGLNGERDQLAATGELTRRLEELQLTTGEGPCVDAYRDGRPVLAGDLAAKPWLWPGFGPEAARAGAAALFSLPLQVGAVRLGTLDLHRAAPGPLSREQLANALILASLATETLLDLAQHSEITAAGDEDTRPMTTAAGWLPDVHADVHVAAGMLSVHWGVGVSSALLGLRAHAFALGEPLHELARRIIDRDLALDHPIAGTRDPSEWPPAPDPENDDP